MGEENLFRRGEIWWLRATVRGREIRESLRTRDLKVARRLRDKRIDEITSAAWHGKKEVKWGDAVDAWSAHVAGQLAPSTARRYAVSLVQCQPYLAARLVREINGEAISALIRGRKAAGATAATIRRDLTAISRVLEFSEAEGWSEGNVTLSKRRTVKERRDPIALPQRRDIEAVVAVASPRFAALIRAAILTGCRQDELVRMTWKGYDEARGTVTFTGKGNKRRTIALSDEASAHFSAQPRTLGSPLIFCRESGEPFAQAASDFCHLKRSVAATAKRAGTDFTAFRFHDLRHLFAVEALHSGMGIYTLSQHLGHSSVKTTEIYLAFLSPDEAEEARRGSAQNTAHRKRFA